MYYVQYARARLCSIMRQAQERGIAQPTVENAPLHLLAGKDEQGLSAPDGCLSCGQWREQLRTWPRIA